MRRPSINATTSNMPRASTCHCLSSSIVAYRCLSLLIVACGCVSLLIVAYRCLSLRVVACRCLSLLIFAYCRPLTTVAEVLRVHCGYPSLNDSVWSDRNEHPTQAERSFRTDYTKLYCTLDYKGLAPYTITIVYST